MTTLFIPTRLKVGYQNREDTYTNKLAYVIYYDSKGKLRKETSWESWRNKSIKHNEYDNVPTSGFILNRNGGGVKDYYYWNARSEFVRVYDPRGFEFEISIPNLLFILSISGSTPGKGLEGEFVYGWDGANLVLLPVNSQDYKLSMNFTNKQTNKIDRKSLIIGGSYTIKSDKQNNAFLYLGKLNYMNVRYDGFTKNTAKDVFVSLDKDIRFHTFKISELAECVDSNIHEKYADLRIKYDNSIFNLTFDKIEVEETTYDKNVNIQYTRIKNIPDDVLNNYDDKIISNLKHFYFDLKQNKNNYYNYNQFRIYNEYILNEKGVKSSYNFLVNNSLKFLLKENNIEYVNVYLYLSGIKISLNDLNKLNTWDYSKKTIDYVRSIE